MEDKLKNIDKFSKLFYSFANFLVLDELGAQQLLIDIATTVAIEDSEASSQRLYNLDQQDIRAHVFSLIYKLACKRYALTTTEQGYPINFRQKAALYLSEQLDYNIDFISRVIEAPIEQVIADITLSKEALTDYLLDKEARVNASRP